MIVTVETFIVAAPLADLSCVALGGWTNQNQHIAAYLAFATLINYPVYVAYLYKSELLGNMEDVKDGTLNKAIRLRINTSEFFGCMIVRGLFYWFLIQPLTWLQSTKEVTEDGEETGRRVLAPYRTPQMYQKIMEAMTKIAQDPDQAKPPTFKFSSQKESIKG